MSQFIFHCGFPKTGSTSLQTALSRSKVNYLGFTPRPDNGLFYREDGLSFFLEQVVRFGTEKSFLNCQEKIEKLLRQEVDNHEEATILSNENIIGRITPFDLPNDIKIRRSVSVLPQYSLVLIGTRKIEKLLYSYYKLLLSNGYGENIEYFFKEILALEDAFGFIDSFHIESIVDCIKTQRPDIEARFFDISDTASVQKCFSCLDIGFVGQSENQSFNLKNVDYHNSLNKSYYSGKRFLDWFEVHRVFPNATFDDDTTYRLSRSRHLHNAAASLNFMSKEQDLRESFENSIPDYVRKISQKNEAYLKQTNN